MEHQEEIIKRLSAGDVRAFHEIYEKYWQQVLTFCERYIDVQDDASDLTQEIFYALWRRREQLLPDTNLSAYLHRAARNQALNYIRNKQRREQRQQAYTTDEAYAVSSEDIQYKELQTACHQSLASIAEPAKTIFRMSREEKFTHREIADALDMSLKMVEYHMGKTLRLLRNSLREFM
jgi:RNA polymerase sigma-70 factor (ECF subfamily)